MVSPADNDQPAPIWSHAIWTALTANRDGRYRSPDDAFQYIRDHELRPITGETPVNTVSSLLGRMARSWGETIIERSNMNGRTHYRINPEHDGSYPTERIKYSPMETSDHPTEVDSENLEEQDTGHEPEPAQPYGIDNILNEGCFLDRAKLETMLQRLQTKRNLILQGPPGTGKTWLAKKLAYALIGYKDDSKVRPLQFHPNLSYEDFVRGWRPQGDGNLELVDGPFLQLIADAEQNPYDEYVMVIEEINRGNPAQIFGEMLTLLEADKRNEGEALALAYPRKPGERVHIPPNVYVIGTMNTADRSIAMIDLALRRRFAFFDLAPQLNDEWCEWVHQESGIPDAFLSDVERRMTSLNEQIADDRSLGPQFRVGHSVVTPPPDTAIDDPVEWFTQVVETEIGPLLDEYWFDNIQTADAAKSELLSNL